MILMYLPFREENFCDDQSAVQVFKDKPHLFRKHSDDPIIRLELSTEIDQALLRVADFNEESFENPENDDDHQFSVDYADRQDGWDTPSADDIFPRQNTTENIVDKIRSIRSTLTIEQLIVFDQIVKIVDEEAAKGGFIDPYRLFVSAFAECNKTCLTQ